MASIVGIRQGLPAAFFAAAAGFCADAAWAQDATWLSNPGSNDFNTGANWSPASVPTGTATFDLSNTTTITANNTVGTLQFNSGAPAYTFNGGFTLTGQGIVNNSAAAPTFNIGGTLDLTNSAAAANATIVNNAFVFFEDTSSAATAGITNNGSTTFSQSATAANATIVNNGGGSLISFADNTTAGNAVITTKAGALTQFTGSATAGNARLITNGTVDFSGTAGPNNDNKISAGSIEGSGTYSLGANQFSVGSNNLSTAVSGSIQDGGTFLGTGASLVKNGTGTLTLTGFNSYTGGTTVNAGILQANGTVPLGFGGANVLVNSGATLAAGQPINQFFLNRVTVDSSGNVSTGVVALAVDSNGSNGEGPGGLDFTLRPKVSLGGVGTVTYSGGITPGANTYRLGGGGGTLTVTSLLSGGNSLVVDVNGTAPGTVILTNANTFTGGTTINAGILRVGADNNLGDSAGGLAFNGGTLQLGTSFNLAGTRSIALDAGGGTIDTNSFSSTISQGISGVGALTKIGAGTLTLSGVNSFTGATTINAGTLALGPGGSLAASSGVNLAAAGTGFDISGGGNKTIQDLSGVTGSTITLGAFTLTEGTANSTTFAGVISGAAGLTKIGTGTLTLTGVNTFAGGIALDAGTIAVGNNAALGTGTLAMADGTTLKFIQNGLSIGNAITITGADPIIDTGANNATQAGVISGSGVLTKLGSGTLTLTAQNTYTGATTVNAGTLAIGAGGSIAASSGVDLAAAGTAFDISGGGNQTIQDLSGIAGSTVALGANTLTEGTANSTTFAGTVTGAGGLTKIGAGTLTLTGANTFTGGTSLNAGAIAAGNNAALGAGALAMADGTILRAAANGLSLGNLITLAAGAETVDTQANALTLTGIVSGAGGLSKAGAGTLTLTAQNTYTGATTVNAGTLAIGAGGSIAASSGVDLAAAGTAFDISGGGNQTIQDLSGIAGSTVALGANTLTEGTANSTTFAGTVTGAGGLTKIGAGTLTLTGANTFTGGIALNAGAIAAGNNAALGAGTLAMADGTTLRAAANGLSLGNLITLAAGAETVDTQANSLTLTGIVSGAGGLSKAGAGTLTLTGAETFTGATTINAGTVALGVGGSIAASSGVNLAAAGAAFDISGGGNQTIQDLSAVGGSTVALGANTLTEGTGNSTTVAGAITGAGGLTKIGTGTLTLTGANTFTGGIALNAGAVAAGNNAALGVGSTLAMADATTLRAAANGLSLTNAVTLAAGAETVDTQANALTLTGVISGAGALTKIGAGTLTLIGAKTYTGATNINAGTLAIGAGGSIAASSGVSLAAAGTSFDISGGGNQTIRDLSGVGGSTVALGVNRLIEGTGNSTTFAGTVTGAGGLTKIGTGTLTLTGANTFAGGTSLNAGAVAAGNSAALGTGALAMANGTTLRAAANGLSLGNAVTLAAGAETVDTQANSLTLTGIVSGTGALTKIGTGTLTLIAQNTYTGATNINAGTLALGVGSIAASSGVNLTAAGAVFDVSQDNALLLPKQTIQDLSGVAGSTVNLGFTTLETGTANSTTFAGTITNNGLTDLGTAGFFPNVASLNKIGTGTLTLTGASTYGGGTGLIGGAIAVGNNTALGIGGLTMQDGTTLRAAADNLTLVNAVALSSGRESVDTQANTLTLAGVISGTGDLVKVGSGKLILTASETYTGATVVDSGTLSLARTGSSEGLIAASSGLNLAAAGAVFDLSALPVSDITVIKDLTGVSGSTINLGNTTLELGTGNSTTFAGTIAGVTTGPAQGGLAKFGAGTLTLTGASTFSGGIALNAGAIAVGNNTALGTGTLAMADGTTLQFVQNGLSLANKVAITGADPIFDTGANTGAITGVISGTGALTKIGAGTLLLNGVNTYTGATNIDAGTLALTLNFPGALIPGSIAASSGVNLAAAGTAFDLTRLPFFVDLDQFPNLSTRRPEETIRDLSGVSGSTVALGNAILTVGTNNSTIFAGTITSSTLSDAEGGLNKIGAGTLTLTGANTYAGGTDIRAGAIAVGNNAALGTGALLIENGATLQAAADNLTLGNSITLGFQVSGAETVDTQANALTLTGIIFGTGQLTKTGTGTLTLTGSNAYSGGTLVAAGTLALGANTALGTGLLTLDQGTTLQFTQNGLTVANPVRLADTDPTIDTGPNNETLSGVISGNGLLTKIGAGTLTLPGANTYTGGTAINAGTIAVGNGAALGAGTVSFDGGGLLAGAPSLTLANAFTFPGSGAIDTGGTTLTLSGALSGAGALAKNGAGTLVVTGDGSAYTGAATVNAGTLTVGPDAAPNATLGGSVTVRNGAILTGFGTIGGNLVNNGLVVPGGSIGTLTARGNYTQSANATLQIEVSPAAASLLRVGGTATLAGTVALVYDPGVYTARSYTIVSANRVLDTFTVGTTAGAFPAGFTQTIVTNPADVELQLTAPAPPPPDTPPTPAPPPVVIIAPTNATIWTAVTSTAVINGQQANSVILDRLGNRQGGVADGAVAGVTAAPVQYAQAGAAAPLGAMASALPAITEGAWFRGIGGFASLNGSATAPGYTGTAGGFLAGFDRPVASDLYVGVAGGYLHSDIHEHSTSNGAINTARIALYGGSWWERNLFTATAGYAHDWLNTQRGFVVGTAVEDHGGDEATMAAQWSHPLDIEGFGGGAANLTPKAGFQFLHLSEGGFAETGAGGFDLSSGSRTTDSFQPYVGLAASQKFVTAGGTQITPELRLGYAREALSNSRLMTVTTVGGFNFPVIGVAPSRDMVTAGFGITMQAGPALSLYGNYDTILRTGNTTDHAVSAGLRFRF